MGEKADSTTSNRVGLPMGKSGSRVSLGGKAHSRARLPGEVSLWGKAHSTTPAGRYTPARRLYILNFPCYGHGRKRS